VAVADGSQGPRTFTKVVQLLIGHPRLVEADPTREDLDAALRFRKRQRREEHGFDDAEDGGGGADAERQREKRRRGKAGTLRQTANRVSDVLPNRVEHVPAPVFRTHPAKRSPGLGGLDGDNKVSGCLPFGREQAG
jgi:hypothetical protein